MKHRLDLIQEIEDRLDLGTPKEIVYSFNGEDQKGLQYPPRDELLYDIAQSLRLLIEVTAESWQ